MFTFSVAALAEAWGYDGKGGDMIGDECVDFVVDRRHASTSSRTAPGQGRRAKTAGVLGNVNTAAPISAGKSLSRRKLNGT